MYAHYVKMKKLISILLAVMTLVSLLAFSTVPVAADEEAKEYTMSAIVMMYPDDPYDDYCVTRFIFNWTEADNSDIPTGFEAWWGTGSVSDSFEYYTAVWGDCLWSIANAYGLTLNGLLALNPQIKNPNVLYVGDRVRVR